MHLKHYDHDGRARFVTFCTHKKVPILTNDVFRQIVLDEIVRFCQESQARLLSYVIMPEHVHLVIVPRKLMKLGPEIGELKRRIAVQIVEKLRASHSDLIRNLEVVRDGQKRIALWLRRCFDHNCRTENQVWRKVNYCHMNPVKRKLVGSPENWKWSSYKYYLEIPDTLLEIDLSAGDNSAVSGSRTKDQDLPLR
ncbi:MAG: transposase [Candidatus Zixiibacteriota bacterium]